MKYRLLILGLICAVSAAAAAPSELFIPMDATSQTNHLKAYGIAYVAIQKGIKVDWLLNYRGGSFGMENNDEMELLCIRRGVSFTKMTGKKYAQIVKEVSDPSFNGQVVKLEKAAKIAVYTPLNKEPWDDAVTMALTYAEIPFDKLYATEVLAGDLDKYDWLHLHHEDFTGQYGKFWAQFRDAQWYKDDQKTMEALAVKNGYKKVSQMQLAVAKKIRDFVTSGGNMFAMCTATETFDIALAADGVDICDVQFDGDPMDPDAQKKLDFSKCLAFKDFRVSDNALEYSRSNIDNTAFRHVDPNADNFSLITPPGKLDPVSLMLCQDHVQTIKGFMGQTTAFRKDAIKPNVMVLGDRVQSVYVPEHLAGVPDNFYLDDYEARYIHGELGKGSWTFLGGHDPEAYQHHVGDVPTDLSKYPNSPGYRLILNNVLFPAVKKSVVPTVVLNSKEDKTTAPGAANELTPDNGIKIFPNPANDELLISCSSQKITQVTITNISGQEAFNRSYNDAKVSVDMNSLSPGMYLIKVNGEYVGKVVKQ